MKKSEVIEKYRAVIIESMRKNYRCVLESGGRIQVSIYIWDDGEIKELEDVQGGNNFIVARYPEERNLYFVCTIAEPYFDPWDCVVESKPEDEEECLRAEEDIIDWVCEEYNACDILDVIIANAEQEEKY